MLATLPFGGHGCFKTKIKSKSVMGKIAIDYFNSVDATFPLRQKNTVNHGIEPQETKVCM
jgi:hypothetical protein